LVEVIVLLLLILGVRERGLNAIVVVVVVASSASRRVVVVVVLMRRGKVAPRGSNDDRSCSGIQ